jgi:hypothetical protein
MITWDLLLPTLPHRHDTLLLLLAELDRQWQPGFGMIAYRDNLQRGGNASYGKWQDLQEMSRADYISFIGDDDWVAPDFVSTIMAALQHDPDYVGFPVRYTYGGELQVPVEHSLRHGTWYGTARGLYRDIVHINPIRRELALLATWHQEYMWADRTWAEDLRNTRMVNTEVWIPEPMYHYRQSPKTWTQVGSDGLPAPLPREEIMPLPEYPWLTIRDET